MDAVEIDLDVPIVGFQGDRGAVEGADAAGEVALPVDRVGKPQAGLVAGEPGVVLGLGQRAVETRRGDLQAAIDRVSAWQAGCHGYYRAESGRIVTQWPFTMTEYDERTRILDEDAFEVGTR